MIKSHKKYDFYYLKCQRWELKISEIEYKPNEIDKERFLFTMIDSNYVYINISRMEKINKYNTIVNELEGKKGIIHLDSGDYIEIKD